MYQWPQFSYLPGSVSLEVPSHIDSGSGYVTCYDQCCCCSVMSDSLWPYGLQHRQASLSFTISEFAQTHVHWVSDAIQPSHPLSPLLLLPSTFPSIRVFSNESILHIKWPKYWNFSVSPSNEYSRLISFRTDWFDLLAVQGALKSLCQYQRWKRQFLIIWPSLWSNSQHAFMTTGKIIGLFINCFPSFSQTSI